MLIPHKPAFPFDPEVKLAGLLGEQFGLQLRQNERRDSTLNRPSALDFELPVIFSNVQRGSWWICAEGLEDVRPYP